MSNETMWNEFARTGDPLYYLLYRATDEKSNNDKEQKRGTEAELSAPVS